MVQNYMETLVTKALNKELTDHPEKYTDLCQCPSCLALVKATALHQLDPFYVTCVAGEVYGEYLSKENQSQSDVMVAIGRGIDTAVREGHHPAAQNL